MIQYNTHNSTKHKYDVQYHKYHSTKYHKHDTIQQVSSY